MTKDVWNLVEMHSEHHRTDYCVYSSIFYTSAITDDADG
jgi:sterol desaturase/sphingolipid hydroxylase (fatty acid hydroxylase superfamily)